MYIYLFVWKWSSLLLLIVADQEFYVKKNSLCSYKSVSLYAVVHGHHVGGMLHSLQMSRQQYDTLKSRVQLLIHWYAISCICGTSRTKGGRKCSNNFTTAMVKYQENETPCSYNKKKDAKKAMQNTELINISTDNLKVLQHIFSLCDLYPSIYYFTYLKLNLQILLFLKLKMLKPLATS